MKGELTMHNDDCEEALCYECEEAKQDYSCDDCGELFCEDCWLDHVTICYECGGHAHQDDAICCDDCDEYFCNDCWAGHVYFCYECDEPTHQGDAYYCDDCGEHFCEDCWHAQDLDNNDYYCGNCRPNDGLGDVHDCGYRPDYRPKGDPAHTMMGVELEVGDDYGHNVVEAVQSIDPDESHLYMKEDGSICGVEIVTHPMTLEWAREYQFDEMLRGLRRRGCRVNNNYGLHVHVSRDAFRQRPSANRRRGHGTQSQHHQMTWLMFVYRNSEPLKRLARRDSSEWASFHTPRPGELKQKSMGGPYSSARYVAVNCNNRNTYELRFFQSTLNAEEFWAALEFADASVKYTRNLGSSEVLKGGGLSWERFTNWCSDHGYANLHAQILKTN